MSSKKLATILAATAMFSQHHPIHQPRQNNVVIVRKPPKGTIEYCFDENGEILEPPVLKTLIFFKCYAINKKNAIRKFIKFNKKKCN